MDNPHLRLLGQPKEVYLGSLFRVMSQEVEMPGGRREVFERAERPPGVRVLASNESQVLVTKEWREETAVWDYRLPGGKVFDSMAEYVSLASRSARHIERAAQSAAQREFEEETSIRIPIEQFKLLGRSVCGATVVWDLYYFVAELPVIKTPIAPIASREGERIQPEFFTREEVIRLCVNGLIREDRTAAVLLRYFLSGKHSTRWSQG